MKYLSLPALCFLVSLPVIGHAEEQPQQEGATKDKSKLIFVTDLAGQASTSTKTDTTITSPLGSNKSSTDVKAIETRSAKPGGLQLGILNKTWGMLANITPDTATSGIVGAGYAVFPGQYVGLAYLIYNNSDLSKESKNLQGLLGYHVLPIGSDDRVTVLWVVGQTSAKGTQNLGASLGDQIYHAKGSSINLTVRYNMKISENVFYSPAFIYRQNSTKIDFDSTVAGVDVEVEKSDKTTEIVPVSITLQM